jgi:hypothetical protein
MWEHSFLVFLRHPLKYKAKYLGLYLHKALLICFKACVCTVSITRTVYVWPEKINTNLAPSPIKNSWSLKIVI